MPDYLVRHLTQVEAATRLIEGYIRRTPLVGTDMAPELFVKPECFQPTGSFKVRGAFNALLRLRESPDPPKGVVTVSSGNHAQALALAARSTGFPALVLIP